jgi:hypothetical protein
MLSEASTHVQIWESKSTIPRPWNGRRKPLLQVMSSHNYDWATFTKMASVDAARSEKRVLRA